MAKKPEAKKEKLSLLPNRFTPRNMRKKFAKKSGTKGPEKQKAFKRCKTISDQFIHQSSKYLLGNKDYIEYCRLCDANSLRKG